MVLPVVISRNQTQRLNRQIRGSLVTVLGSGGSTQAGFADGIVTGYEPPENKKAIVRGQISLRAIGSNTTMSINTFDQSAGRISKIATISSSVLISQFEVVLQNDMVLNFSGDNSANDGSLDCNIEIEELPA